VKVIAKAPGILTPEQCQKLLDAADSALLPVLAIQAFCGVRTYIGAFRRKNEQYFVYLSPFYHLGIARVSPSHSRLSP
jgi:hypothetical protein